MNDNDTAPEAADPLPAAIRERFSAPAHGGPLAGEFDALAVGEAGNPADGAWARLEIGYRAGRVAVARFQAYGCPWLLASADWLCEHLEALPASQPPGGPLEWARLLGLPEARLTRLLLLEDALRAALARPDPFPKA